MISSGTRGATLGPSSIIAGVEQAVIEMLGIEGLRHRHALDRIAAIDGPMLVDDDPSRHHGDYVAVGATADEIVSRNWR